jgi:hypothetical protein
MRPLYGRGLDVVLQRKRLYGGGILFPSRQKTGHVDQKLI